VRYEPRADRTERYDEKHIEAFGEFTDALAQGRKPDIEEHMARYPEMGPGLRADMETAKLVYGLFHRFRARYPDKDLLDVLLPDIDEDLKHRIRVGRGRHPNA
jgi:hypothetical protein